MVGRRRLALVALVALVVSAGCAGAARFEASPATAADRAVTETGYEFEGTETRTVTREYADRNVTVVNRLATYERSVELPGIGSEPVAAVVVLSTPGVELLGTEYNPVADATLGEVADRVAAERSRLRVGDREGARTVTTLGTETTLARFDGATRVGPTSVDTTVHVLKVGHEGDYVVLVGAYPAAVGDDAAVVRLAGSLTHG